MQTMQGTNKTCWENCEEIISGALLEELGEINENWFADLTERCSVNNQEIINNGADACIIEDPLVPTRTAKGTETLVRNVASLSDANSTPKPRARSLQDDFSSTPVENDSPLVGASGGRRGRRLHPSIAETPKYSTPLFSPWPTRDDRSFVSLSVESSEDLDNMLVRALDSDVDPSNELESLGSDLVLCGDLGVTSEERGTSPKPAPRHRGILREFLQRTPGSVVRQASVNRLREALGVDPSHTGLSWTSSLATPPGDKDERTGGNCVNESPAAQEEVPLKGAARKLFSPGCCDTDNEEVALDSTMEGTPTSIAMANIDEDNMNNNCKSVKVAEPEKAEHKGSMETDQAHDNKFGEQTTEDDGLAVQRKDGEDLLRQNKSLSGLEDLMGTPPSRVYPRKSVLKKRASIRHSLPSTGTAAKMVENIMAEKTDDSLESLESGLKVDGSSNETVSSASDPLSLKDNQRDYGDNRYKKDDRLGQIEQPEIEFTQLSQTSLNAFCDAVSKSESSLLKAVGMEKNLPIKLVESKKESPGEPIRDVNPPQNVTAATETLKEEAIQTPRKAIETLEENTDIFSQISPSAMDSIFSATETLTTTGQNKTCYNPSKVTKAELRTPEAVCKGVSRIPSPVSSSERPQHSGTGKRRMSIGLRRKPGRFLYPTSNQISSGCPKKFINFQSLASSSIQGNNKLNDNQKDDFNIADVQKENSEKEKLNDKEREGLDPSLVQDRSHAMNEVIKGFEQEFDTDFSEQVKDISGKEEIGLESSAETILPRDSFLKNVVGVSQTRPITAVKGETPANEKDLIDYHKTSMSSESQIPTGVAFMGFQSASGKKFKLDDEAVSKYAGWFDEDSLNTSSKISCLKNLNPKESTQTAQKPSIVKSGLPTSKKVGIMEVETDSKRPEVQTEKNVDKSGLEFGEDSSYDVIRKTATLDEGFVGFKTAAGNELKMDKSKLAKYENWFLEDLPDEKLSGGGKIPDIKKNNKKVHNDVNDTETEETVERHDRSGHSPPQSHSNPSFVGFKTAGGKDMKISKASLSKYEKWFEEEPGNDDIKNTDECEQTQICTKGQQQVGFSTASGKQMKVDSSAVAKFSKWFEEEQEPKSMMHPNTDLHQLLGAKEIQTMGFSTASGKQMKVESSAVAKFSKWFEEENMAEPVESQNVERNHTIMSKRETQNAAPISASKKEPKDYSKLPKGYRPFKRPRMISNPGASEVPTAVVSTSNAKQTAKDQTIDNEVVRQQTDDETCSVRHEEAFNDSLDTFTYTQITEATEAAQALLLEDDSQFDSQPNIPKAPEPCYKEVSMLSSTDPTEKHTYASAETMKGFQTAAGKIISFSSKALQQAEKLWSDITNEATSDIHIDESLGKGMENQDVKEESENQVRNSFLADQRNDVHDEDSPCHPGMKSQGRDIADDNSNPTFVGFSTAAGKKVNISEEALNKAKSMLADKDGTSNAKMIPSIDTLEQEFFGFSTAAGKHVKICEKALKEAQILLEDNPTTTKGRRVEVEASEICPIAVRKDCSEVKTAGSQCLGFVTAAGKGVNISEKALKDAQKLLSDVDKSAVVEDVVDDKPKTQFQGFSTAAGKRVEISAKALKDARVLLEDNKTSPGADEEGELKGSDNLRQAQTACYPTFTGFSTASGKTVAVSEKSLLEAKNKLSAVNTTVENLDIPNSNQRASNDLSKEPDHREDVQNNLTENVNNLEGQNKGFTISTPFMGFSTAGGKSVSVSNTALQKVQKMFTEDFESTLDPVKDKTTATSDLRVACAPVRKPCDESDSKISFPGFSSASGKAVVISESALLSAQKLLDDDPKIESKSGAPKDLPNKDAKISNPLDVFSTTSGHRISVSDDSQYKIKSDRVERQAGSSTTSHGFSTANGKAVTVTDDALKKAQKLLTDSDSYTAANLAHTNQGIQDGKSEHGQTSGDQISEEKAAVVDERHLGEDHDVMKEISESSKALLADGDETFGEESSFAGSGTSHPIAETPVMHKRSQAAVQKSMHSAPARLPLSRIVPFKAVSSNPEEILSDRCISGKSTVLKPLISAPEKDIQGIKRGSGGHLYSWQGPTSYKDYNNPLTDDRLSRSILQVGIGHKTMSKPVSQSTPVKSTMESSFTTPYKKTVDTSSSSFKPPVKNFTPAGGFKTPLKSTPKRTSSDAGFISPLEKKTKVEEVVEEDSLVLGKSLEDELLEDWEQDHDSIVEALSTSDLENLDKNCKQQSEMSETREEKVEIKVKVKEEVVKARMKAKVAQAQQIREKRETGGVKPHPGAWYSQRRGQRGLPLQTSVGGLSPRPYTKQELYCFGVRESVLSIWAANANEYCFSATEFYEDKVTYESNSVRIGDSALLVWDDSSTAGKEEFCNAFLDMEGVDPKLTCRDWVYNHYRWIVWKLAAMETAFPQVFGGRCLTPDRVMLQLKYRYDREVDNSQRSAVKKIFERDDTPAKVLVLCISGLVSSPHSPNSKVTQTPKEGTGAGDGKDKTSTHSTAVIELTDGWYPIKALLDGALSRLLASHRLKVGDKIVIYGAELVGSQDAAPPLQAAGDTMLKISANCCRRAAWYSRLGYQSQPQPPALPLSSLYPDGGTVSCVDVVISRIFPLQFMERTPDGGTVFRSERAEERTSRRFESMRQKQLEVIYSKLQTEFEKKASSTGDRSGRRTGRRYSTQEIADLSNGQEIYEALQSVSDEGSLEAVLTAHQQSLLTDHQRYRQEELQAEMQAAFRTQLEEFEEKNPKRNVTPLLKVRVVGCSNRDIDSKSNTVLTVWRPSDDVMEMFSEGKRFLIYHLSAGESKGRMKGNSVSLAAQRMTRYKNVPVDDNFLDLVFEPREVTDYSEFTAGFQPAYDEVDCVGIVVLASPVTTFDRASGDEGQVQTVYMADANGDFIALKAWGGTMVYGLDELLKESTVVSLSNLTWRSEAAGRSRVPTLSITEATQVTTNPKDAHLRTALDQLKGKLKNTPAFVGEMKERLHSLMTIAQSSYTPQSAPQVSVTPGLQETPRTVTKPASITPRTVIYPRSDSTNRVTPRQPTFVSGSSQAATPSSGLSTSSVQNQAGPESHNQTMTPRTRTPQHLADVTPDPCDGEKDPAVAKKRALQRLKAYKLSKVADHTPVTPLYSTVPAKLRKAFKLPTMARSASPDLTKAKAGRYRKTTPAPSTPQPQDSRPEKLYRKLNFCDQEIAQTEEPNGSSEGDVSELKSVINCEKSSETLESTSVSATSDQLTNSDDPKGSGFDPKPEGCNSDLNQGEDKTFQEKEILTEMDQNEPTSDIKTRASSTLTTQSGKRALSDSDSGSEEKPQRKKSTRSSKRR